MRAESVAISHEYMAMAADKKEFDSLRNDFMQFWLNVYSFFWNRFKDFDGRMLLQYKRMMHSAPQYFYHSLEDILHLKLVEILRFSQALEELE